MVSSGFKKDVVSNKSKIREIVFEFKLIILQKDYFYARIASDSKRKFC